MYTTRHMRVIYMCYTDIIFKFNITAPRIYFDDGLDMCVIILCISSEVDNLIGYRKVRVAMLFLSAPPQTCIQVCAVSRQIMDFRIKNGSFTHSSAKPFQNEDAFLSYLTGMDYSMIKKRRSQDRLFFSMSLPIFGHNDQTAS